MLRRESLVRQRLSRTGVERGCPGFASEPSCISHVNRPVQQELETPNSKGGRPGKETENVQRGWVGKGTDSLTLASPVPGTHQGHKCFLNEIHMADKHMGMHMMKFPLIHLLCAESLKWPQQLKAGVPQSIYQWQRFQFCFSFTEHLSRGVLEAFPSLRIPSHKGSCFLPPNTSSDFQLHRY